MIVTSSIRNVVTAAFDLVWLNGRDLRERRYIDRKKRLANILAETAAIGYVEHFRTPAVFDAVARLDLEGIVAKRVGDPYSQSTEWLKVRRPEYSQWKGRHELFDRGR